MSGALFQKGEAVTLELAGVSVNGYRRTDERERPSVQVSFDTPGVLAAFCHLSPGGARNLAALLTMAADFADG